MAQVVGAGYGVSGETGDTATIVKLLRVAMLLPACLAVGLVLNARSKDAVRSAPLLPWFAVAFAVLVVVNSLGVIPDALTRVGNEVSRWCLVTAIAAIGMKTTVRSLADMGPRPVMLLVLETLFLAALVLGVLASR